MSSDQKLNLRIADGKINIATPNWPGLKIGPGECRLRVNDKNVTLALRSSRSRKKETEFEYTANRDQILLLQTITRESPARFRFTGHITNFGKQPFVFNHCDLFKADARSTGVVNLGAKPAQVRILEQSGYYGQVRSVGQIMTGSDGRLSLSRKLREFQSEVVCVLFEPKLQCSLMVGFESFERFAGHIEGTARAQPDRGKAAPTSGLSAVIPELWPKSRPLRKSDRFRTFSAGFPGGDIRVDPGETVTLEEMVIEVGQDPFRLLESFADRIARSYGVTGLPEPHANWCSWYPFRLSVTEDHLLATAQIARERHLDQLGLKVIQVDLGWETRSIPTYFEENERFPHGLLWLSRKLQEQGFQLGAWKGFTCVSENHPVAKEHPDWLVRRKDGTLVSSRWYWIPHDTMYALDATHPGAQEWVRKNIASLAARGVRYLKWDFGGNLHAEGTRHNPKIACSGAYEGMRLISGIVRDAMGEDGLILDCTNTEFANLGHTQLWYTNYDTGNTGAGFKSLHTYYSAAATHLFKQHRLALLQPSCAVLHGPGGLEEARFRATVTFMMAGHVDIGDELTTLPEERWQILKSMLPPPPHPARPVDLFYPVRIGSQAAGDDAYLHQSDEALLASEVEPQGAIVWHMPISTDWDEWQLVAVLNYFSHDDTREEIRFPNLIQFHIPLPFVGLEKGRRYWAHEFWSGMFLGNLPRPQRAPDAYLSFGSFGRLILDGDPRYLALACAGPAVKLLVIRKRRRHPWPVATTFHQSGGTELEEVHWDATKRTLSGILRRSPGEQGMIFVAGIADSSKIAVRVNKKPVPTVPSAYDSIAIQVRTSAWETPWEVSV